MRFLTQEWVEAVVAALSASGGLSGVQLCVHQIVTGTPQGDVEYWICSDDGAVTGGLGAPPGGADVTFTQDLEVASALARGELNLQAAFMQGRLKVSGNMGKLLRHQTALDALGPAMATVGAEPDDPQGRAAPT